MISDWRGAEMSTPHLLTEYQVYAGLEDCDNCDNCEYVNVNAVVG